MRALTVPQSEEKNKRGKQLIISHYIVHRPFSFFSVSNYIMRKSLQITQGIAEAPHLNGGRGA